MAVSAGFSITMERIYCLEVDMAVVKQSEYEALAAFRYSLRRFLRFSEEAAHSVGLTPHQHQALLAIKGFPGRNRVTVSELAERLQIRHHTAVELTDRLVAEALVERQPSSTDHRQVYVTLSKKGFKILEQLSAVHKEELRRLGPQLRQILSDLSLEEPS